MNVLAFRPKTKDSPEWKKISHNLQLHVPSGFYYVRKYRAGKKRLFKSTGEKRKGLAQTIADSMVSEWLGNKIMTGRRFTVSRICDELLVDLEKEFMNGDRRKRTLDHDRTYLPIIKSLFGEMFADEVDESAWLRWVQREGRGMDRTLGDIAKYLSKVLTYAHSRKYIPRKPTIENPDKRVSAVRVYDDADIMKFIEHAEPMLSDLIVVAAETGMRPHETREIRWIWICLTGDRAIISLPADFTKTARAREIETSENVTVVLRRRKNQSPFVFPLPSEPLKPISDVFLSRMWRKMLVSAGMPEGLKFHWLRHTFFTRALIESKLPLAMVADYGGNSPTILFQRYLKTDSTRTRAVAGVVRLTLK